MDGKPDSSFNKMDSNKERQSKLRNKSTKRRTKKSCISPELDDTLPDDIFLDSFDKFRYNEHQELRANKVLKKDIRASFNRDSSVEMTFGESNSSYSLSTSIDYSSVSAPESLSMLSEIGKECSKVEQIDYEDSKISGGGSGLVEEEMDSSNEAASEIVKNDLPTNDSEHQIQQVETNGDGAHPTDELSTVTLSSSSASSVLFQTPAQKTALAASTPMTFAEKPKLGNRPRVLFDMQDSIHELSNVTEENESSHRILLKGGKWRRTIFEIRKYKITLSPRRTLENFDEVTSRQSIAQQQSHGITLRRKSMYIKDVPDRKTIIGQRQSQRSFVLLDDAHVNLRPRLRGVRFKEISDVSEQSCKSTELTASREALSESSCASAVLDDTKCSEFNFDLGLSEDQLKSQLLIRCGQIDVLLFDEIYSQSVLSKCRKIGEGVFGEVFLNEETSSGSTYILKVIPIEGDEEINGAVQKRFDEILQEVIISQELSALREGNENRSTGFVEVLNVRLVRGRYPAHLIELWNEYDAKRQSENDCPDVFGDDQLYVVFELANGGTDLEAYCFKNAEQSFAAFKQVALSLAAAESEFEFEHRDLHWGNVLVAPTTETTLEFILDGKSITVRTHGIKATIIDYTLSRLVYKNCCLFQDLATDPELFEANGDYQFDVYRLMRVHTNNEWEIFEPYTNVLWLHYTIDKMIAGARYSAKSSVKHRQIISQMTRVRDGLLEHQSATDYILKTGY